MSNELIPADVIGVVTQVANDEDFADLGKSGFLQRIELKSRGELIDTGVVKPGHYCISKGNGEAEDIGASIDVLVIARRPKAIDMTDKENLIICYDRKSDVFRDIEKRSYEQNSHCQFGASFLVVERSTGGLYELFLGSKSNRLETNTISAAMAISPEKAEQLGEKPRGPIPLTLKSERITKKKEGWSWFVIKPTPCSNPFTKDQVPKAEVIKDEVKKFLDPDSGKKQDVKATEPGKEKRAR
jgi:hypothetical protein